EFYHLSVKRHAGAAEGARRVVAIPAGVQQGREHRLTLRLAPPRRGSEESPQIRREVAGGDARGVAEDERRLDDVAQLANVARPIVAVKRIEKGRVERLDAPLQPRSNLREETLHQRGNVFEMLA